jgi:RHS repeat-associated protein
MESTQIQALYEPPPAAMQQLSEKPRHGFETRKTAGKPGSSSCNFTVALGLRATVVENGVRETYSARFYNPATGRFLSRDPEDGISTDPQSLHKYLYAGGDPVNRLDPSGRFNIGELAENIGSKIRTVLGANLTKFKVCFAFAVISGTLWAASGYPTNHMMSASLNTAAAIAAIVSATCYGR